MTIRERLQELKYGRTLFAEETTIRVAREHDVPSLAMWMKRSEDSSSFVPLPLTLDDWANSLNHDQEDPDYVFLMLELQGVPFGYFALHYVNRIMTYDAIGRGEKGVAPGGIGRVIHRMHDFCFEELNQREVALYVFADNRRAIKLYERCGFLTERTFGMRRTESGWDDVLPGETPERNVCYMIHNLLGREVNNRSQVTSRTSNLFVP